jgi:hypothetical protein
MSNALINFESRNGCHVEIGMRVAIYRNLNNGKISIKDEKLKKVLGYADIVNLKDVTLKIRKGEQARAQRDKCRNVHAYAIGTITSEFLDSPDNIIVSYNPFENDTFYNVDTMESVQTMSYCQCFDGALIGL